MSGFYGQQCTTTVPCVQTPNAKAECGDGAQVLPFASDAVKSVLPEIQDSHPMQVGSGNAEKGKVQRPCSTVHGTRSAENGARTARRNDGHATERRT